MKTKVCIWLSLVLIIGVVFGCAHPKTPAVTPTPYPASTPINGATPPALDNNTPAQSPLPNVNEPNNAGTSYGSKGNVSPTGYGIYKSQNDMTRTSYIAPDGRLTTSLSNVITP